MADDTTINKLDGTLRELTGMSQEELLARRDQKKLLVSQREELEAVKKQLEGLGKESVKSSKFLKLQNKLAEDEKKFERRKFTDMLKERARSARAALVQGPGNAMAAAGGALKEGAGKALGGIGGIIKGLIGPAGIFGLLLLFMKALQNPKFREVVSSLITFVKGVFTNTFDFLKDAFNGIVTLVTGVTDKLGTIFSGDATVLERIKALAGIFTDFGSFILNIGDSLITNVLEMFGVNFAPYDSAGAWLLGKLNDMWTGIKNFFTGAVEFVQDGYTNIKEWVTAKVSSAWQSIKDWFFGSVDFVVDGAGNIKDWLVSKVTGAWSSIKEWFSGTADFVVEGATGLKDFITSSVSNSWSNVKNWFSGTADMAAEKFTDFSAFVGDKMKNTMGFAEDLFSFSKEDMTAAGVTSKLIDIGGAGINLATNFAKDVFGFGNPEEPFKLSEFLIGDEGVISKLGAGLVGLGKKIYDPETGEIFGFVAEIPSLSDMFTGIKNLAKKIYDPETGAIFGFQPGNMFDFQLPNFGDLFMNLAGSMLPSSNSLVGKMLYALPGTDTLKQAADMFGQGGQIVGGKMELPASSGVKKLNTGASVTTNMSLDEVNARIAQLEDMAVNAELAGDIQGESAILNRIDELSAAYDNAIMEGAKQVPVTIVKGGDNTVSSQSNSTFSLQKGTSSPDTTFSSLSTETP